MEADRRRELRIWIGAGWGIVQRGAQKVCVEVRARAWTLTPHFSGSRLKALRARALQIFST